MKIYSKNDPLLPVDMPVVNGKYHVSWGNSHGVVGICVSIDEVNKTVVLRTPKTRKLFKYPVKWNELRHIRRKQAKIESQQNKN